MFLNGAILGMTKAEVAKRFDEIVAFSGVEQFIDTPVKRYSSGMTVRLAFAVAAHLEPEIMIVDEVLAVGDAAFQKKCLGKMQDVAGEGRTVLFVSHNMGAVSNLCSRVLLMDAGRIRHAGEASACISEYLKSAEEDATDVWNRPSGFPSAPLEVRSAQLELRGRQPRHTLYLSVDCVSVSRHKPGLIVFDILDPNENAIMQVIPDETPFMEYGGTRHSLQIEASLPPLIPGRYRVAAWVGSNHNARLDAVPFFLSF